MLSPYTISFMHVYTIHVVKRHGGSCLFPTRQEVIAIIILLCNSIKIIIIISDTCIYNNFR